MKNLVCFFTSVFRLATISLLLSAFFGGIQWAASYTSICSKPTIAKFVWGAVGLFILLFLHAVFITALTMYRYRKDPLFKDANLTTGIGWKEYQQLKQTKNERH